MSIYRKATLGLALAVSMAAFAGHANAQGYTGQFVTFTKALGTGSSILNFNAGTGTLTFTPNPMTGTGNGGGSFFDDGVFNGGFGQSDPGAKFSFGPLTGGTQVTLGDVYHWSFSGAFNFKITDNLGTTTLLEGDFTGARLNTESGSQSGGVLDFGGVTYTGGDYLSFIQGDFPDTSNQGNFSLSLSGINHGGALGPAADGSFNLGGGNIRSGLTGNFNIVANVPEPGEWAAMGILATGLGGLVVRARRKSA